MDTLWAHFILHCETKRNATEKFHSEPSKAVKSETFLQFDEPGFLWILETEFIIMLKTT